MFSLANEASGALSRTPQAFRAPQAKSDSQDSGNFADLVDSNSTPAPASQTSIQNKAQEPNAAPSSAGQNQQPDAARKADGPASDKGDGASAIQTLPSEDAAAEAAVDFDTGFMNGGPGLTVPPASEAVADPMQPVETTDNDTDADIDPTAAVTTAAISDSNAAIAAPALSLLAAADTASAGKLSETGEPPIAADDIPSPQLPLAEQKAPTPMKADGKQANGLSAPDLDAAVSTGAPSTEPEPAADDAASADAAETPAEQTKADAAEHHSDVSRHEAKQESKQETKQEAKKETSNEKPQTPASANLDNGATAARPASEPASQPSGHAAVAAAHAATASVAHAPAAPAVTISQPIPINALAVEFAAQARAGNSRFEIRLDPPELGRIDVRLDVDRDGNVTSRLMIERADTYDLLRRDQSALERALQQAGLKTSDNALEFSLRDQSSRDHGFARQQPQEEATSRGTTLIADVDMSASGVASGYARLLRSGNGIDIRV